MWRAGWVVAGVAALFVSVVEEARAGAHDLGSVQTWAEPFRPWRIAKGAPALPSSAWETASTGEMAWGVVAAEGSAAKKSWALLVVDVPIERMWAAINDETWHKDYTDLRHVEVLSGSACQSGRSVLQVLDVNVPGVQDRWWIVVRTSNKELGRVSEGWVRELVWESRNDAAAITSSAGQASIADATPITFTRGAWYLTKVDEGHTLVEYYAWVDPGGSLPAGAMTMFAGKSMRGAIDQMAAIARDGRGRCTAW
jgi:hypothetical protein